MKNYFYGIYGIEMIWHGEWADPELIWHKRSFNYFDVEDTLYSYYREECNDLNRPTDDNDFAVWG